MSAAWYYAHGNQRHGPVSLDEIRILLASGRLTPEDLAWREGMASWAPIRTISELASGTAAGAPVAEPGMAVATGGQSPESTSKAVDIGACLNRAWELYMREFGPLFGVTFLTLLLTAVAIFAASSVIPYAGAWAADALVGTPLTAGLLCFCLKKIRGETPGIQTLFAGFSSIFAQLAGFGLIVGAAAAVSQAAFGHSIAVAVLCVLGTIWIFALPLMIDRKMLLWPAMETSRRNVMGNVGVFLLLFLLCTGIFLSGTLACGVGFIFTAPLSFLVIAYAYNDRFCPPDSAQAR